MATKKKQKSAVKEKPVLDKNLLLEIGRRFAIGRQWRGLLELAELLKNKPELAGKLKEALQTDRFFITVTFQKKYKPSDEHDLHNFWTRRNFMVNDVVPSLKQMASDFIAKENPTAELPDKNQWH